MYLILIPYTVIYPYYYPSPYSPRSKTVPVRQWNAWNAHVSDVGTKHSLFAIEMRHPYTKTISDLVHLTIRRNVLPHLAFQCLSLNSNIVQSFDQALNPDWSFFGPSGGGKARRLVALYQTFPHIFGATIGTRRVAMGEPLYDTVHVKGMPACKTMTRGRRVSLRRCRVTTDGTYLVVKHFRCVGVPSIAHTDDNRTYTNAQHMDAVRALY